MKVARAALKRVTWIEHYRYRAIVDSDQLAIPPPFDQTLPTPADLALEFVERFRSFGHRPVGAIGGKLRCNLCGFVAKSRKSPIPLCTYGPFPDLPAQTVPETPTAPPAETGNFRALKRRLRDNAAARKVWRRKLNEASSMADRIAHRLVNHGGSEMLRTPTVPHWATRLFPSNDRNHWLCLVGGFMFCNKCGGCSGGSAAPLLSGDCGGQVAGGSKGRLERLRSGKTPQSAVGVWADGRTVADVPSRNVFRLMRLPGVAGWAVHPSPPLRTAAPSRGRPKKL